MTTWIVDNGGETVTISNLDQIPDGDEYVKSHNDYDDAAVAKLAGIDTNASDDQTGDEIVTAINDSNGGIDADALSAGSVNKLLTANEKAGAGYAYDSLYTGGIKNGTKIAGVITIETVVGLAADSFQKSSDTMDDINDSQDYVKVSSDSMDQSNRVRYLYDGTAFRSIGTLVNQIPLLSTDGRLAVARSASKAVVINGSGKQEQADGSTVDLDDLDDGATYVRTPIGEVKEIPLFTDAQSLTTAGSVPDAPTTYVETGSLQTKIFIPYRKAAGDTVVGVSALVKNGDVAEATSMVLDLYSIALATGARNASVVSTDTVSTAGGSTNYEALNAEVDVSGLTNGTLYQIFVSMTVSGDTGTMSNVYIYKKQKVVA